MASRYFVNKNGMPCEVPNADLKLSSDELIQSVVGKENMKSGWKEITRKEYWEAFKKREEKYRKEK